MAALSIKETLWASIDKRSEELIKLCSDMVKIPSENPPGNVDDIVLFIQNYLSNKGIKHKLVGPDSKYPSIVAGIGEGPSLVFNGHCDVVPAGDKSRWNFDPYGGEITSSAIRGRGTSDMKCGLGAALFTMALVHDEKVPLNGRVEIHVVPDEETGGSFGTKWLVENGYADNAFVCLVAEPTGADTCEVGQKGQVRIHLSVAGKAAHGSIGNYVGENAILKTMKILSHIDELRKIKGSYSPTQHQVLIDSKDMAEAKLARPGVGNVIDSVTVNPGIIKGGTKVNMVPDLCETDIDIRIPIGLSSEELISNFEGLLHELNRDKVGYKYETSEANITEVSEPIVKTLVKNAESVWNKRVIPAYQWASSDARYYRLKGIPTLQYGPSNTEGIHSYNEDVDIVDVINAAKIYVGVICDLLVEST